MNILQFVIHGGNQSNPLPNGGTWTAFLHFETLLYSFSNSFNHLSLQHMLLNVLCFFVCGLYLERKIGSIKFALLVLMMAFFASATVSTNHLSVRWKGFSIVNYGLYAYIIIDYVFSFRQTNNTKFNVILGAIVLALIYLAMCFSGNTSSFGFKWYPYDLLNNIGHYSSALAGLALGLTIKLAPLGTHETAS